MKPPDRLLHDIGVFEFMIKFWLALPIAASALFGLFAFLVSSVFDPWNSLASAVIFGVQALFALFVVVAGGKLFVSLFQMAGNKQDREPPKR